VLVVNLGMFKRCMFQTHMGATINSSFDRFLFCAAEAGSRKSQRFDT
jgi:hypothetical protein